MIYINGIESNLYNVIDLIDAEAENKGYDPDDAFAIFWNAIRHRCEESQDMMRADFEIEVVA